MAIPVVLGIAIVNFLIIQVVPGDPATALVGDFPAPPEYIEAIRRDFGLDRPILVQLWHYLANLLQGNLGFSFANRLPVLPLILQRAGTTLLLVLPSLVAATLIAVALSLWAAEYAGRARDMVISSISLVGYAMPVLWLGQLLILLFAVDLGWFPAQGMRSAREELTGFAAVADVLWHMALPAFCVTFYFVAIITRVGRASILEVVDQDFVLTARAKGLSPRRVRWRHIVPNALIPIVTVVGLTFGSSLTVALLTEAVFAWPGLGNLFIVSIARRDYPVLQGIFLLSAIMVVFANLLTDLCYSLIDPRVRASHHRGQ